MHYSSPQALYIAGRYQNASSGETFDSINPATGEVLAAVQHASIEDVDKAVQAAEAGFLEWSTLSGMERGRILNKAVALLRARNAELALLEVQDTGKPLQEAIAVDIVTGADVIEYYAGLAVSIQGSYQDLGKCKFFYTRR